MTTRAVKYPTARWFNRIGTCLTCGKPGHGWLMSFRNDKIGTFCVTHGEAAVKVALDAENKPKKAGKK